MAVLVVGAGGMLGEEMRLCFETSCDTIALTHAELDIGDSQDVVDCVSSIRPTLILNCAAFTNVDRSEDEPAKAMSVNAAGAQNVAYAANKVGACVVYISSDYVFSGVESRPYSEEDPPNPINVYGESKSRGEMLVREMCDRHYIVRTSWLFGRNGRNFVDAIYNQCKKRQPIRVVSDQVGRPTYAKDLADAVAFLVSTRQYGTYHIANSGHCSWYEFALDIIAEAGLEAEVVPISTEELHRRAARPKYSVLDISRFNGLGRVPMRHYRQALRDYLTELRGVGGNP